VILLDQLDPVQLVHPSSPVASRDRTSVSSSLVEHTHFDGPHGRLHAVANSMLGADMPYVSLYGAHTYQESPGDLLVGLPLHH
jgi:hypothetical protein